MAHTRGKFITFEGMDGSGKTTQVSKFASMLKDAGTDVVQTREPGGSQGAEEIRRLLVEGDPDRWSPETEILLFTAARRDHCERLIKPNMDAGRTVISDRFADSTRVYQGAARADLGQKVDQLHEIMIAIEPDITFVIDLDPATALTRGLARHSGEDRFEELGLPFQEKLRVGYRSLVDSFPNRCFLIDGNGNPQDVAKSIWQTYLSITAITA
jgi:dTMP kinase